MDHIEHDSTRGYRVHHLHHGHHGDQGHFQKKRRQIKWQKFYSRINGKVFCSLKIYMYNLKSQKILLEHAFTQNKSNANNFQTSSNMFEGRQVQQSAEVWEPSIFWRQVSILRQNSERFHNLHLLMDIRRPFAVAKPFLSQNLKKWIFRTSRSVRKFSRSDLFHCLQSFNCQLLMLPCGKQIKFNWCSILIMTGLCFWITIIIASPAIRFSP